MLHSAPTIWVALCFSDNAFPRSKEILSIRLWHPGWRKSTKDQHVPTAAVAASTTCGSSITIQGTAHAHSTYQRSMEMAVTSAAWAAKPALMSLRNVLTDFMSIRSETHVKYRWQTLSNNPPRRSTTVKRELLVYSAMLMRCKNSH